jgi:predicted ABC-type ATPase
VPQRSVDRPALWIVAGPNGSGKSTLYDKTEIQGFWGTVWIINPDALTARIREREGLDLLAANGEALDRIEKWLTTSVDAYQTVGVETVLSTDKYRALVDHAKSRGFHVRLLYVTLQNAELNVERVKSRVKRGGHDVPEQKIRARRARSFQQLPWFLERADYALVFDNSGAKPVVLAEKVNSKFKIEDQASKEIRSAVDTAISLIH